MTEQEFALWKAVTESSRFHWVEDEIVRLNGRGAMYYTGDEDGIYMRIGKDGKLEAGLYEGAIPHIGEAMFQPKVTRQFDSFSDAFTTVMQAGGKQFLVDMFSRSKPQPLVQTDKDRASEEKPSVLKQIRESRDVPTLPGKENAPEQKKHKGEPEL